MTISVRTPFSATLMLSRKAARLTEEQLAKKANIPVDAIRRYEKGAESPDFDTAQRLLKLLELEINHPGKRPIKFPSELVVKHVVVQLLDLIEESGLTMSEAEYAADELVKAVERRNAEVYEKMLFHMAPAPEMPTELLRTVTKSLAEQLTEEQVGEVLTELNLLPQTEEETHDKD